MALRQVELCYQYQSIDSTDVYQWWEVWYWEDSVAPINDATIGQHLEATILYKPWLYISLRGFQVKEEPGSNVVIQTGGPPTVQPNGASYGDWYSIDGQAYASFWVGDRKVGAKWLRGYSMEYLQDGTKWQSPVTVTIAGYLTTAMQTGPLRSRYGEVVDRVTIDRKVKLRVRRHGSLRRARIYMP